MTRDGRGQGDGAEPARDGDVITRVGRFADRDLWSAEGWCTIEKALGLVGTRSAIILLREAFLGSRRFEELARRTGLSDAVAAKRLKQLVDDGLLTQHPYREPGSRTRHEYVLTERGRSLFPVLVALKNFGAGVGGGLDGLEFVHAGCGGQLTTQVRCAAGHDVPVEQVEARFAPGAGQLRDLETGD